MPTTVPIRLLVHFQTSARPLVQITEGVQDSAGHVHGAGTRAVDTSNDAADFPIIDHATQLPTGERATIAQALSILYSLAKR
jgi:hypothetical protein